MNNRTTIRRANALDPYASFIGVCAAILFLNIAGGRPAFGQGDRTGERQSLADVSAFSVAATVEGPEHLASSEALHTESLVRAARDRLKADDLPVTAARASMPDLHIHLNMMQIQNGLIAFSVELDFFQEVALTRNQQQVRAVTWNESVVGLVSQDLTSSIAKSVLSLIDQFADDFRAVN